MFNAIWASILILVRWPALLLILLYALSVGPACRVCDQLEPYRGRLTETHEAIYAPLGWACNQSDLIGGIAFLYIHWWMTIGEGRVEYPVDPFLIEPPETHVPIGDIRFSNAPTTGAGRQQDAVLHFPQPLS
jgi:hypothetical protein